MSKETPKTPTPKTSQPVGGSTPTTATASVSPDLAIDAQTQPAEVLTIARSFYDAYTANSGGKAWDGKPCPPWDHVGNPVQSHWCATVIEARHGFALVARELTERGEQLSAELARTQALVSTMRERVRTADAGAHTTDADLRAENGRLKFELDRMTRSTGAVDERRVSAAVGDRTKLLESEVDGLRAKVAALEKEKATGFKPWAARHDARARAAQVPSAPVQRPDHGGGMSGHDGDKDPA